MTKEEVEKAMSDAREALLKMSPEELDGITDVGVCAGPNEEEE